MENGLQATSNYTQNPRVDFDKKGFDDLIAQKGRRVSVETALLCPCKGQGTNAQSNCKNCGGTGYSFVNQRETLIVTQNINVTTIFAPWSEENLGWVNISCNAIEHFTFMDKITAIDGEAVHNQVLFLKQKGDTIFTYTVYPIKKIEYVGVFIDNETKYLQLIEGTDFTYNGQIITIINSAIIQDTVADTSITVRYIYAPVFHIIDFKRETMETFEYREGNKLFHLPLKAFARRAHYILNQENLSSDRLLNNDFNTLDCSNKFCN